MKQLFKLGDVDERGLLPLWDHGLKRMQFSVNLQRYNVAPFMGAWIETPSQLIPETESMLLPLWEHGLKHYLYRDAFNRAKLLSS